MYFIWSLKAGLLLWVRQTGSGHWDFDDGLCVCALVVHWYEDSGHWSVIGQLRKHIIIIMVVLVGHQWVQNVVDGMCVPFCSTLVQVAEVIWMVILENVS